MANETSSNDPKDVTPKEWSSPKDARKMEGAGTYPNYYTHKTRSGHLFMLDDSEGAEHVTLQHRSGSAVQFMPDGAVVITSHNGQYNLVFGENRVKITGAHDVTVEGAASLDVKGDYNCTVQGNMNTTVNGDMNVTAKNYNATIRGSMDISAKNLSQKIEGNSETTSHGNMVVSADGGVSIKSTSKSVGIQGNQQVGIKSTSGKVMLEAGNDVSVRSKGGKIAMDGAPQILMNQNASVEDVVPELTVGRAPSVT